MVPVSLVVGLVILVLWGGLSAQQAVIQGIGTLLSAVIAHQIYVRRSFVERGDPALAWMVVVWSLVLMPRAIELQQAIWTWVALMFSGFSLHLALLSHRQPSTSGIQFRSGALAGLAITCDSTQWGIIVALLLVQLNTRPAILREWLMLGVGLIWTAWGLNVGLRWMLPASFLLPSNPAHFPFEGVVLWGIFLWALVGGILLLSEQAQQTLRIQNTRMNALLFFGSLVLCSILEWDLTGWISAEFIPLQNTPFLAMGLAFFTVQIIPKRDRYAKSNPSWVEPAFWVFVGTLLVLFTWPLLR
jgi:hypothetical protein